MCIYCGTNNYRKIYEYHYGPILKDRFGRSLEVHHIDGNHQNNNPLNLALVTIDEHYAIHYERGDYCACYYMSIRMKLSPAEISVLSRKTQLKRVAEGSHHFQSGKIQSATHKKRVKNGTHHFLDPELARKAANDRISNGTHPSQIKISCIHCHRVASSNVFNRWHSKCK